MRQVGWSDLVTGNKRLQSCCLVTKSCPTLHDPMDCRLLCPWDSPGKNTRVGGHFLLQEIFPTQGLNPCLLRLLHWQVDSLPHSHQGSLPYPSCGEGWFSAGSSFPEQGGVGVLWGRGGRGGVSWPLLSLEHRAGSPRVTPPLTPSHLSSVK